MSSVAAEITFTISRIRPSKTTLEVAVAPGGRSLRYVTLHVRDHNWLPAAGPPGAAREPAPSSADETYQAIENWLAAGAPCPAK
ncbi:hypothetical protein [Mesorhizobium sp. M1163]|uniref:hypothetical protein n=1 Tax=Mesorhizobium sp. M1163 TaxID=2957065 RepID=UPI00333926F9